MSSQTMWALVKDKPEVGLTMKRVEIPQVGDNDVKIKIRYLRHRCTYLPVE